LPTYPLDTMTRESLERAALNPYRFASLLVRCESGIVDPLQAKVIAPIEWNRQDAAEDPVVGIIPFLLPGGRFLLTFQVTAVNEEYLLSLLDLGYDAAANINPVVVCSSIYNDVQFPEILGVDIIHDNPQGFRVFISTVTESLSYVLLSTMLYCPWAHGFFYHERDRQFLVCDVHPMSQDPTFEPIAMLTTENLKLGSMMDQDISLLSCWKTTFSFLFDLTVVVWDFISNEIAAWAVEDKEYTEVRSVL
jgi:hypothetical protein